MNKSVLVAMSGGVDSSVAAALLVERGFKVIGVTMKLWQDEEANVVEGGCCSLSAVNDARRVADVLGIPHYVLNFSEEFKESVIKYFINEYYAGRTPNPCIACNKYIKFDFLLKKALAMGMDYIATGHYARIEYEPNISRWLLKKSLSIEKDQTYVLYNMTQYQLEHTLFPIGDFEDKKKVREIAAKLGLRTAEKSESQEICFVDGDYGEYIERSQPGISKPGNIVDVSGKVLGKHRGIIHYTIGQRKGLGIAAGRPLYVIAIDPKKNEVIVGGYEQLFSRKLIAKEVNLISIEHLKDKQKITAKIRYSAKEAEAYIMPLENGKVLVEFVEPQRAITPGQSVVFYNSDIVVGGGVIEAVIKE